jgi:sugar lactone lactonase YvrE
LDARASRVLVVTPEGDERRKIASPPELLFASDLALGPQGTVYVVDSVGHRVYSASKGDKVLAPLSDDLSEDLDFATSIAVDERGNLFLGDQNGGGIVVLGRDGSFRGRQSRYGWKPGMLRYPTGLCVDRGVLFVADRGNNRVQMFEVAE